MSRTYAVIASGQSLTKEHIELIWKAREQKVIKGVIAVSNAGIDMIPDADALVSHDSKWWRSYPDSMNFHGRKFCRMFVPGTEQFIPSITQACNSGLMAMEVAVRVFKADRLILLGFDMHGTHYFGRHPDKLKNTTDEKFKIHRAQFRLWKWCEVINCTPGTALKAFPCADLENVLSVGDESWSEHFGYRGT